jgi:hypothetical protein
VRRQSVRRPSCDPAGGNGEDVRVPMFAGSALPAGMTDDRLRMGAQGPTMITTLPLRPSSLVAMDTVITQDHPPEDLWHAEVPPRS